jgi:hypothetical protein
MALLFVLINPQIFLPVGGPDDVPMEIQTQRFLNHGDVVFDNGFERTAFRKTGGVMHGEPPIFPDLSPYTSSVFHTREGSDDLYLTIVWHFTDADNFTRNRDRLKTFYLEREGRSFLADLNLEYEGSKMSSMPATRTTILNVTGFENNITAGYFTTIGTPGDKSRDFFIVYFGAVRSGTLNQQTPYLRRLMEPVFDPENFDQLSSPI